MLAWQVEHLDSGELTRAVDDWSGDCRTKIAAHCCSN